MAGKVPKIHLGSFLPHPYQFNVYMYSLSHSTVTKYSEIKINKNYLLRNPNGEN
jgi:hypothetical protein